MGDNVTASETPNAAERKRARRHKIALRLYEALVAQDSDRLITLRDGRGEVLAHHDPLPAHDPPDIASVSHRPTANEHDY
jgi:hypothetical protein